jgi:uncharacterized membrane protein
MTDERFERWIAFLLRVGVLTAAAVVLAGAIGHLVKFSDTAPGYRHFQGEPAQYRSGLAIVHAALAGDWLAIIQFGLLILIATPVARVALSIVAFALERDWTYVAITTIVLGILLYSLI